MNSYVNFSDDDDEPRRTLHDHKSDIDAIVMRKWLNEDV